MLLSLIGVDVMGILIVTAALTNFYYEKMFAESRFHEALAVIERQHIEHANAAAALQPSLMLPSFQSAKLVATLNDIASSTQINLEEVSYVLEESTSQPFLRYRITFTALSKYPVIKKMITQLQTEAPHIMLEAISCSRDDINVADVSCDLVFSAFFKKA